jgi:hypothetical protein
MMLTKFQQFHQAFVFISAVTALDALLQENGDYLLLETGDRILL